MKSSKFAVLSALIVILIITLACGSTASGEKVGTISTAAPANTAVAPATATPTDAPTAAPAATKVVAPTDVPAPTEAPADTATATTSKLTTFKVGDIVKMDDYTLTLNSAKITGSNLVANFTIDNTAGAKDLLVSSMMSFSAKDSEGTKLKYSFCTGSGSLDGSVLAGDKLKGDICYSGVKAGDKYRLYYIDVLSSGAIVWEVQ